MTLKANSTAFGKTVRILVSGETGMISAFASYQRQKEKQFLVEYKAADGRAVENWFFESQIELVA